MKGVILDRASLGPADLDLAALLGTLESWEQHAETATAEVAVRIRDADVVLSNKVPVNAADMAGAPRLRLIQVMATGTNNIDLAAAKTKGITVSNVRGYAAASVAQHTLLLMLSLARNLVAYRESVKTGDWSRSGFFCLLDHPIIELQNRHLGIIGMGDLGREVARLAQAFGMNIASAALPGRSYANVDGAEFARMALDELLAWADVISIHCPLNAATRDLIGERELRLMKPSALLVNTARGGIVNEAGLLRALRSGWIAGAALDTLEREPPASDEALIIADLPNLLITPHIAWAGRESRQQLVDQMTEVLKAFREGREMNRVN